MFNSGVRMTCLMTGKEIDRYIKHDIPSEFA